MLRFIPLILLVTSCQALGIKDTDTIKEAEMKVIHKVEDKVGIHHEAEPPMITAPAVTKADLSL